MTILHYAFILTVIFASSARIKELKFIHITKTAGESFSKLAERLFITWGRFDLSLAESSGITSPGFWHIPPRYFKNVTYFDSLQKQYDYFVVVRNPYDRLLSEYSCKYGRVTDGMAGFQNISLQDWLHEKLDQIELLLQLDNKKILKKFKRDLILQQLSSWDTSKSILYGHYLPQHIYLYLSNGKRYIRPDNILRIENINDDFRKLAQRYNIKILVNTTLTRLNSNAHEKELLDPNLIRRINKVYHKDFVYYGYEKKRPSKA